MVWREGEDKSHHMTREGREREERRGEDLTMKINHIT